MSTDKFNENYPNSTPHWSFELSTTLDRPLNEAVARLAGVNNFEACMKLNPTCTEYAVVKRDRVVVKGDLSTARVREFPSAPEGNDTSGDEGTKEYERVFFTAKGKIKMLWGLLSTTVLDRGTYVWDEETKTGLWEATGTDNPKNEIWVKKVMKFTEDGPTKTKVVEAVEGHCPSPLPIFENLAMSFCKDIHA